MSESTVVRESDGHLVLVKLCTDGIEQYISTSVGKVTPEYLLTQRSSKALKATSITGSGRHFISLPGDCS